MGCPPGARSFVLGISDLEYVGPSETENACVEDTDVSVDLLTGARSEVSQVTQNRCAPPFGSWSPNLTPDRRSRIGDRTRDLFVFADREITRSLDLWQGRTGERLGQRRYFSPSRLTMKLVIEAD